MAYTDANIAKTLLNARQYLKSGFVKNNWICHSKSCNNVQCCAEGAVMLAVGLKENIGFTPTPSAYSNKTDKRRARYAKTLIDMLDTEVANDPEAVGPDIVSVNDHEDSKYADVAKYFNKLIRRHSKNA